MDEFTSYGSKSHDTRHHKGAWCWAVARRSLLGISLTVLCQTVMAQAVYRIKPLGTIGGCTLITPVVHGFNGADEVTGEACNARRDMHAFLWRNDGSPMIDLVPAAKGSRSTGYAVNASGLVAGSAQDSTGSYGFVSTGNGAPPKKIPNDLGGNSTYAYALNNSGQVTGSADVAIGSDAFLWKDDGSPMVDLGNQFALGYPYTSGEAINAAGQVAGTSWDGDRSYRAFIWKNDGSPLLDLGDLGGSRTLACCINASGQVAGSSSIMSYAHPHAFLWKNDGTGMHDLGTLARGSLSSANALNDTGQVVGWSHTSFYKKPHAFIWMNDGTPMKDLGTFRGNHSLANDVNASGQVTGYAYLSGDTAAHAFLWRNDGTKIQDLNTLIDPTDPLKPYVTLTSGDFINDRGDIVADGTDSRTGVSAPYLLQGTVLTLTPRSLAFGNQPINTTSAAKSVTVTNTGPKAVAITSIALTGTAAGQFASTNNCGKSLGGPRDLHDQGDLQADHEGRQVRLPERERRGWWPAFGQSHGHGHVTGHRIAGVHRSSTSIKSMVCEFQLTPPLPI